MENATLSVQPLITREMRSELIKRFRARIKALAESGRSLRRDARALKGDDRAFSQRQALEKGEKARINLLVYGFLRLREYSRIEPSSRKHRAFTAIFAAAMRYWLFSEIKSVTDQSLSMNQERHLVSACKAWILGDKDAILTIIESRAKSEAA